MRSTPTIIAKKNPGSGATRAGGNHHRQVVGHVVHTELIGLAQA